MFQKNLKIKCPVCNEESWAFYEKDEGGYVIYICPACGEELIFSVKVIIEKRVEIDGDIKSYKTFINENKIE